MKTPGFSDLVLSNRNEEIYRINAGLLSSPGEKSILLWVWIFFPYLHVDKPAIMKRWILYPVFLLLISCKGKNTDTYFTLEKASLFFSQIENACNHDDGKLWGKNLYGPLMFVDRENRKIIANMPDRDGLLKKKKGVYIGILPKDYMIRNFPVTFGRTVFAVSPVPPDEDDFKIKASGIHSLYHMFQNSEGITPPDFESNFMDEKEARYWIKLEWKALKKAVISSDSQRQQALKDALTFRKMRKDLYDKQFTEAVNFETFEGLATFTFTHLCTGSVEECRSKLFEILDWVYSMPSYSRSFAFINGALYSFLLNEKGFDFKNIHSIDIDLADKASSLYNIEIPVSWKENANTLAANYEAESIKNEENKRNSEIEESYHKQLSQFTDNPVVYLQLESPYFDYDTEDIYSLESLGTVYNAIRVSDNWGKLTVEKGGCLVSSNLKYLRISARSFKVDKNHVSGDGWHLILNYGWQIVPVDQNIYVSKLVP